VGQFDWNNLSGPWLQPASLIYSWSVRLRNRFYDELIFRAKWVNAPVISVGNLTTGGTGKTPIVIHLTRMLKEMGYRPGVILRGYGARAGAISDEESLFRQSLPGVAVVADPNRFAAAQRAISQSANVLVADDAYQHRRLGRDVNICLIDAAFPFGNEMMLPAGRLREPIKGLRRADVVIITRADQVATEWLESLTRRIQTLCKRVRILLCRHCPRELVDLRGGSESAQCLKGRRIVAFAGIARPEAFYKTLGQLGATVAETLSFPDHHAFSPNDYVHLADAFRRHSADAIVCTAKDAVKLDAQRFAALNVDPTRVSALTIDIEFSADHRQTLATMLRDRIDNFSAETLTRISSMTTHTAQVTNHG